MAKIHSGEEILPKRFNPMSRVRQRYRQTDTQTTDAFAMANYRNVT